MDKLNLVLIQPFGVNSLMLKGFIDYIDEYFNVYFVDLPGTKKDLEPLENFTIESLVEYVEDYINSLGLEEYILGGISLGFLVVCNLDIDKSCKGIVAMEPCLGYPSLKTSHVKRLMTAGLARAIKRLNLGDLLLNSDQAFRIGNALKITKKTPIIDEVRKHMNGQALVDFAYWILTSQASTGNLGHLPHVLIMNTEDERISYEYVVTELSKHTSDLLVIRSETPHSPEEWTREYFKKNFPPEMLEKMRDFFLSRLYKN